MTIHVQVNRDHTHSVWLDGDAARESIREYRDSLFEDGSPQASIIAPDVIFTDDDMDRLVRVALTGPTGPVGPMGMSGPSCQGGVQV